MNDNTAASSILASDTPAIFAPLWRGKWVILAVAILVAAGTYVYYKHKPSVYETQTAVYLNSGSEEQAVSGIGGNRSTPSSATINNQVAIVNSGLVHEAVMRRLRAEHTRPARAALHGKAVAKAAEKSAAFITITTEARTPKAAALLANTTAQVYIKRQSADYLQAVKAAIALTRRQLRRTELALVKPSKGSKASTGISNSATIQSASLSAKINQLEARLSVTGVKQVALAKPTHAKLTSPFPKKNAEFGFALGLILGAVAAYTLSRFDRRLRSLAGIESVFGVQILTALPTVRRPIVREGGRPRPSQALVEPIRRLHTTLALAEALGADRESSPRVILFLSADAGDGKSSLVADLALIQRDAGERVAVIEADFRRPVQARLLDVEDSHGLAQVLTGALEVDDALQGVASTPAGGGAHSAASAAGVATVVESRSAGSISVLAAGGAVSNPPALLASQTMLDLLRSVAGDFDYVLIDAPPPLEVSDVMPLLSAVAGILLVARVGHTRDASAQRLMQLLARTSSAPVIGMVANCVPRKDIERYGLSSGVKLPFLRRRKPIGR
jgi:Mrp family chromosome partitioning ATPase/capsular polysaccharide biosynthesis protein